MVPFPQTAKVELHVLYARASQLLCFPDPVNLAATAEMTVLADIWSSVLRLRIPIAIALFAWLILAKIHTYWRLRHFRGPFLANFSELWIFRRTLAGGLHETSLDVVEKYGGPESIARVGPNLLMTDNVMFWKAINEDRAWKKGSWYPAMALDPGHDSSFSTQDDAKHDRLKNQMLKGV